MLSARMHGYEQSLVIEDVPVPEIMPDQVLVRVGVRGCAVPASNSSTKSLTQIKEIPI